MEAVAAASRVAGIISLASQVLDGIVKQRRFFVDAVSAVKTID